MKPFYVKLLSIILISSLGIIVYSNTFYCSFHLDDISSIINNSFIRDIHNLRNIWNFLPRRFFLYLSIALNYHFNGLNIFGYHLFNLGVHLFTAILVWWIVLLTFKTPAMKEDKIVDHAYVIALLAGLVFVSHPIQTEAVTYIVQRVASMASFFYLASLGLYVKSRLLQENNSVRGHEKLYYICSLITAVMAMFTKEIAITLPLMIVLYEYSFLNTKRTLNWKSLIPFLLTVFIIPITMLLTETGADRLQHLRNAPGISSMHYFLTQFRVMVTYIRLVFLPINQNFDYDYHIFKNVLQLPVLISFLFLMAILYWAKYLFLRYRLVSFSIFWFFLTLLPESSVLPIQDVMVEHRLYLPLVGYSMFLVGGIYYLWGKNSIKTMGIVLVMIIICNSVLTYQRNKVWKDNLTLWGDVIQKSPHKARPYDNRGFAYANRGRFAEAITDFSKAIAINPKDVEDYTNRGNTYNMQGNLSQAILDYTKAVELNPHYINAYYNRAVTDDQLKEYGKVWADVHKVEELGYAFDPGFISTLRKSSGQDK